MNWFKKHQIDNELRDTLSDFLEQYGVSSVLTC